MANGYKKIVSSWISGGLSSSAMSLWQGADHLLQVERDHYTESYRRFYFADIESLTMRRTKRQWTISFIFGAVVGIFLFLAVLTGGTGFWVLLGFAGFFSIPLIANWAKGGTCVVHLATAVQREEMESVRRVRKALELLEIIRAVTAETQGVMAGDLVRVKFELQNAPRGAMPPPLPPPMAPPGLPPLEPG